METLSTITKMRQLDTQNPGFLAILEEHLDKRKRPSWIASKLSSRYLVALTIQDIVDYIGQKWAAKLPQTELVTGLSQKAEGGEQKAEGRRQKAEAGIVLPKVGPDGVRPEIVDSHAEAAIASQESAVAEEIPQPESPVLAESHADSGVECPALLPVCPLPSTVCPSHAAGVAVQALMPESPVLMIPKAKPPKRAVTTPRKRRAALLELQVALAEKCLIEGSSRMGGQM